MRLKWVRACVFSRSQPKIAYIGRVFMIFFSLSISKSNIYKQIERVAVAGGGGNHGVMHCDFNSLIKSNKL